jgi:DNA repair photolyase
MNLYRGCMHNCVYCDGRSEGYYVDAAFGENVAVKINALEILRRELDPHRRRTPLKPGFVIVGGGVGDSYQPAEEKYQLTRKVLHLLYEHKFPVHILTKSTLVKRDIDILKEINRQKRAIVSFSFSSVDDEISSIFEPGVPPPSERLETLAFFKKEGIACGMFLLPVIPFVTDTSDLIQRSIRKAHEVGADFVIFGGMTLKEGRQKEYFLSALRRSRPELVKKYESIYQGDKWGQATKEYYGSVNSIFSDFAKKYRMPKRIPPALYNDILWENDLVTVMLEHLDYFLRLEGKSSPFSYAAYSISKLNFPLKSIKGELRKIRGIGKTTEDIILEMLETGRSSYYEKLSTG